MSQNNDNWINKIFGADKYSEIVKAIAGRDKIFDEVKKKTGIEVDTIIAKADVAIKKMRKPKSHTIYYNIDTKEYFMLNNDGKMVDPDGNLLSDQ